MFHGTILIMPLNNRLHSVFLIRLIFSNALLLFLLEKMKESAKRVVDDCTFARIGVYAPNKTKTYHL